ncbi:MAG: hypothetical protein QXN46_02790, partial [Candidatus Woesearchaeota archaeon]
MRTSKGLWLNAFVLLLFLQTVSVVGAQTWSVSSSPDIPTKIAVDSSQVYVLGDDQNYRHFRIERRDKSSGNLLGAVKDSDYQLSNWGAYGSAMAIDADSVYVAGGFDCKGGNERCPFDVDNTAAFVIKIGKDFSTNNPSRKWLRIDNPSYGDDFVNAIFVDDAVYAVGHYVDRFWVCPQGAPSCTVYPATNQRPTDCSKPLTTCYAVSGWWLRKLDKSTGAVLWEKKFRPGDPTYSAYSAASVIAADNQYLYIAGFYHIMYGNTALRLEKRYKSNGELVKGFGSGGVIIFNPSEGSDYPEDIEVGDGYIYLVARTSYPYLIFIQKYDSTTGELRAFINLAESNIAKDLLFDSPSVYIAGSKGGQSAGFIEKRNALNLSLLVPEFGSAGVLEWNPNPSRPYDVVFSISADSDYIYVGGSNATTDGSRYWLIERRDKRTGAGVTAAKPDSTPPIVTIYTTSITVEVDASVSISGSYSDDSGVSSCRLFVDSADRGAMSLSAPGQKTGTASSSLTFTQPGSHNFQIKCKDLAGNEGVSSFGTVTVTPPEYDSYRNDPMLSSRRQRCKNAGFVSTGTKCCGGDDAGEYYNDPYYPESGYENSGGCWNSGVKYSGVYGIAGGKVAVINGSFYGCSIDQTIAAIRDTHTGSQLVINSTLCEAF